VVIRGASVALTSGYSNPFLSFPPFVVFVSFVAFVPFVVPAFVVTISTR